MRRTKCFQTTGLSGSFVETCITGTQGMLCANWHGSKVAYKTQVMWELAKCDLQPCSRIFDKMTLCLLVQYSESKRKGFPLQT